MINSVYDYYLTTYASRPATRQDTHKKSDLRNVYNDIVKISRRSPLYKIENTADIQKYAIDLKETARELRKITEAFTGDIEGEDIFIPKKAYSDNESVLDVSYIGEEMPSDSGERHKVSVNNLATPQINTGVYLPGSRCKLLPGAYSFDLSIGGNTYEFQFNINDEETNTDVQNKLARLFNRSGVGVEAYVTRSSSGNTALEIRSQATGIVNYTGQTFDIRANSTAGSDKAMEYFALNRVTNQPTNASFTIDGINHTSASNSFTINNEFQITLKDVTDSDDDPVGIGFKHDIDNLIDSTENLLNSYNNILKLSESKASDSYDSSRLFKEIQGIVKKHRNDLESSGVIPDDKGYLTLDKAVISQSVSDEGLHSVFNKLDEFKNDIQNRADSISINPMHYVNKTLISYPNPVRSYANPYITSIYSGMMFNGYV